MPKLLQYILFLFHIVFQYESKLWQQGFVVVGVDEVGRGAFAGPIVAASCVFSPVIIKAIPEDIIINDSKLLTATQRKRAFEWIKKHCLFYAISSVDVDDINKIGIVKANIAVLRRSITKLINKLKKTQPIFVLSDYFQIPYLKGIGKKHQLNITHGDEVSFSIAAASIIAKVKRDKLMKKLSRQFPCYQWEKNKGYGTFHHRKAIKIYGKTEWHREVFVQNYL